MSCAVYIEEAAGISKYKERRRDTEGRMQRTMENLERLTDIRDELGRQIGPPRASGPRPPRKYAEYQKTRAPNLRRVAGPESGAASTPLPPIKSR